MLALQFFQFPFGDRLLALEFRHFLIGDLLLAFQNSRSADVGEDRSPTDARMTSLGTTVGGPEGVLVSARVKLDILKNLYTCKLDEYANGSRYVSQSF